MATKSNVVQPKQLAFHTFEEGRSRSRIEHNLNTCVGMDKADIHQDFGTHIVRVDIKMLRSVGAC